MHHRIYLQLIPLTVLACGGVESPEEEAAPVTAVPLCSAALKASLLASAPGEVSVVRSGHCRAVFTARDVLAPLRIRGAEASGLEIRCNGARIEPKPGSTQTTMISVDPVSNRATLEQEMLKAYDGTLGAPVAPFGVGRPENVRISGCRVRGAISLGSIGGAAANLSGRSQSDTANAEHTARMQAMAPRRVFLQDLEITAPPELAIKDLVYFHTGVTESRLTGSSLRGEVTGTTVYLAPESARNIVQNNHFGVAHAAGNHREIVAIDGSADNQLRGNSFTNVENGGIHLYRNCGEAGGTRHQAPSGNEISDNDFYYRSSLSAAIWVGRRSIFPGFNTSDSFLSFLDIPDTYCRLDERSLTVTLADGTPKVLERSRARLGSSADTVSLPVEAFGLVVTHFDVNEDDAARNSIHDNNFLNYGVLRAAEEGTAAPPVYRRIAKFSEAASYPGSNKKDAAIKFSGRDVEATNTQLDNQIRSYPRASCRPSPAPLTIAGITRSASFDAATGLCFLNPR